MEPTSHRIRGANDLDLHLLEWSTEGVPLVLLHGLGNEAHLWDDFVPSITPHYRVLALDQRGHGDSDWDPEARYDAESMADDLEAMIETMGIDRFVLIGFSMGGRVAMTFAGRHPDRLHRTRPPVLEHGQERNADHGGLLPGSLPAVVRRALVSPGQSARGLGAAAHRGPGSGGLH